MWLEWGGDACCGHCGLRGAKVCLRFFGGNGRVVRVKVPGVRVATHLEYWQVKDCLGWMYGMQVFQPLEVSWRWGDVGGTVWDLNISIQWVQVQWVASVLLIWLWGYGSWAQKPSPTLVVFPGSKLREVRMKWRRVAASTETGHVSCSEGSLPASPTKPAGFRRYQDTGW
jgi:hypothetical protein